MIFDTHAEELSLSSSGASLSNLKDIYIHLVGKMKSFPLIARIVSNAVSRFRV